MDKNIIINTWKFGNILTRIYSTENGKMMQHTTRYDGFNEISLADPFLPAIKGYELLGRTYLYNLRPALNIHIYAPSTR